jgi:hypothetical protein
MVYFGTGALVAGTCRSSRRNDLFASNHLNHYYLLPHLCKNFNMFLLDNNNSTH